MALEPTIRVMAMDGLVITQEDNGSAKFMYAISPEVFREWSDAAKGQTTAVDIIAATMSLPCF